MAQIDTLVKALVDTGGSDLHLSVDLVPMVRSSGEMTPLEHPVLSSETLSAMLDEIMPERNRVEFAQDRDTDFGYEIEGYVRLRVNAFEDRMGVGAVLRAIPCKIISAEQLDLPKGVTNLCRLSQGLVVVTGPTGSGKSTTLAAMVDLINRTRRDHIITIEDPIEFVHPQKLCRINQREVNSHTKGFARALRAALRQDPDIVLVGEMRDLETIEIAIDTAETGHLVFGTLHTSSAAGTVSRIIDAFPASRQNQIRTMLASSLKGVIAQTLCKRIEGGRVAALEIMLVERGVSALIRDGKTHQLESAMQVGRSLGMQLLNDSLADLVRHGVVGASDAYYRAVDKEDLLTRFTKYGIPRPDASANPGMGPTT
ncbi:MAG: type IV pilus twitching motility protein PilT [Verrucomicrobia bacterium]|jgi:twitching motility protein PilT|nr:type IV pilus twitching motility protein PilT [Verrucomicrobiota bacterium]MBT7702310.1 type IV pilus twitching motility protein PilT [Verrucomicrobiota bacterium]